MPRCSHNLKSKTSCLAGDEILKQGGLQLEDTPARLVTKECGVAGQPTPQRSAALAHAVRPERGNPNLHLLGVSVSATSLCSHQSGFCHTRCRKELCSRNQFPIRRVELWKRSIGTIICYSISCSRALLLSRPNINGSQLRTQRDSTRSPVVAYLDDPVLSQLLATRHLPLTCSTPQDLLTHFQISCLDPSQDWRGKVKLRFLSTAAHYPCPDVRSWNDVLQLSQVLYRASSSSSASDLRNCEVLLLFPSPTRVSA
jgi:hypothetical protein